MSIKTTFGLNLHISSFDLPRNILKETDEVRVSITTIPDENKQAYVIPARKMKDSDITFHFNVNIARNDIPKEYITMQTEKIIVVFRKKSFFSDPIIASTIIPIKELPKDVSQTPEQKVINIYVPLNKCENDKVNRNDHSKNRKIIGRMNVQMNLTEPCHLKDFNLNNMNDLSNVYNNSIFNDDEVTFDDIRYKDKYFGFHMLKH